MLIVEATKMHVPKFREGILNGCCVTKANIKHVLPARMHIFTESIGSGKPHQDQVRGQELTPLLIMEVDK